MSRHYSTGFTFIEVNISMVIIAMIALFASTFFMTAMKGSKTAIDVAKAKYLAIAMMNEIRVRSFDENTASPWSTLGSDAGEGTKDKFDDIDDFNGFTESSILNPDGTANFDFAGYSRSVTVVYVDSSNVVSGSSTDRKKVTVNVTRLSGSTFTIEALITAH